MATKKQKRQCGVPNGDCKTYCSHDKCAVPKQKRPKHPVVAAILKDLRKLTGETFSICLGENSYGGMEYGDGVNVADIRAIIKKYKGG